MNSKAHLNKTQIVDKNGKTTHVYRKDDGPSASAGRVAAAAAGSVPQVSQQYAPVMKAPMIQPLVDDIESGDRIELGYGEDYTSALNTEYPSEEARAFRCIRDNAITGEAFYEGQRYTSDGRHLEHRYEITLTNSYGSTFDIPYSTGIGHDKTPSLVGVLENLASDASLYENSQGARDFGSEMGYDMDDPEEYERVKDVYKAVRDQTERFKAFLGEEEYEALVWGAP